MTSTPAVLRSLSVTPDGTVSFEGQTFLEPAQLAGAAALAERARRTARPFALKVDASSDPARFASRMRLGAVLGSHGFGNPFAAVREHPHKNDLLEVSVLDGASSAQLARLVGVRVRSGVAAGLEDVADALCQSAAEIGGNAELYAGHPGYVAAVFIPGRRELLVAVADCGVGLAATLAGKGATNDGEALGLALQGVGSGRSGNGSGIRTTFASVSRLGGEAFLVTGTAAASLRRGRPVAVSRTGHPFQGTLFQARIPLETTAHTVM